MRYLIESYGCQLNMAEADAMDAILRGRGLESVSDPDKADVVIINTCSVRKSAENRIWGRLGFYSAMKRKHPMRLIVTGCMAERMKEELKQEAAEENDQVYYDPALRAEAVKQARFYLSGGTTPLCFIDKYMYEIFRDEGILAPLSDILGEKPENAFDDYGIYLKDTEFGQYYSVFSELPEDTVVCMAVRSFVSSIQNNKQDEQRYNNHVALFRKILEFDV